MFLSACEPIIYGALHRKQATNELRHLQFGNRVFIHAPSANVADTQ